MAQITFKVEMVVDIPNMPFTAKLTQVVNSIGNDITLTFVNHCKQNGLGLSSQTEIEQATESFRITYGSNSSVLP